jgi:hypothetical protein
MIIVDLLDLNGEGKIDIVIYNTTNGVSYTVISSGIASGPNGPFSDPGQWFRQPLWRWAHFSGRSERIRSGS